MDRLRSTCTFENFHKSWPRSVPKAILHHLGTIAKTRASSRYSQETSVTKEHFHTGTEFAALDTSVVPEGQADYTALQYIYGIANASRLGNQYITRDFELLIPLD